MPEARLQRTRDAYDPEGRPTLTEVLDALPRLPPRSYLLVTDPTTGITTRDYLPEVFPPTWRRPSENAAEQLQTRAEGHRHEFALFDPRWGAYVCHCGARRDWFGHVDEPAPGSAPDPQTWNVIEGDH